MTATQRFIEDAIKGGWGHTHEKYILHEVNQEIEFCTYFKEGELDYLGEVTEVGQHKSSTRLSLGIALLDPLAWQAVGKTRGWTETILDSYPAIHDYQWRREWHRFIDYLADEETIDEALQAIE
jgi:hypothetical protein